ncbi:MAG: AAA family ATPase [Candidatus Falkowbacteria bacterium]
MAKDIARTTEYVWPSIGNDKAIEFLNRSILSDKIAQTYVFIGPEELGKSTIALAFARNLQGDYDGFNSDLYVLNPEPGKKGIGIEQVREFIKMLNLSSFMNSYKIGLIKEADLLSEEAKSALLKTLEEPKDKVIIIMLVNTEESLPATILSRSQKLYFYPVPAATIYDYLIANYGASRSLAKDLASLALGRPLKAIRYLENPEVYKTYLEEAESFLSLFNIDLNARLKVLDSIFTDKTYSKQATEDALSFLLMAEGLFRDMLLLVLEQKDRVQHLVILSALEKSLASLPGDTDEKIKGILNRLKFIAQAKEYLEANVNPRLVLEQLIVNL